MSTPFTQPPMIGTWSVLVQSVRPFTIHGDLYYEVIGQRVDDSSTPVQLKIPQHAVADAPAVGQRLVVSFLMGQVTGVKFE
jgi:hypothetical protein